MLHAAYEIHNMCRFLKNFVWVQPTHDPSFRDAFAKSPEGGASGMLMPHPMTLILYLNSTISMCHVWEHIPGGMTVHAVCAENGHSSPAGDNGEVQLTVREMLDVPSDSRPVDLPAQDRDAFAEAGVLEQRRSVQPGDRAPPQPLVRTLEEVAEKLGEWLARARGNVNVSLGRQTHIRGSGLLPFLTEM